MWGERSDKNRGTTLQMSVKRRTFTGYEGEPAARPALTRSEIPGDPDPALSGMTCGALIGLFPAHDAVAREALAVLYDRHAEAVYGLGLRVLSDTVAGEELLQETFWWLWTGGARAATGVVDGADGVDAVDAAATLLHAAYLIAVRSPRYSTGATVPAGHAHAVPVAPVAPVAPVTVAFANLAPEVRRALDLTQHGRLRCAQIAVVEGVTAGTIRQRLATGLSALVAHKSAHGSAPDGYGMTQAHAA